MMLKNRTVVTGAGGGLGEGIARVCHREGANVVVADIRGDAQLKPWLAPFEGHEE